MPNPISEEQCVELLEWAVPRLGLRWDAFQRNKRQVCRRLRNRIRELQLPDPAAYAGYLERTKSEWPVLDAICAVTISRFYRDREVFDQLVSDVIPALMRELPAGQPLRVWSAGCASGEEPYSIALMWELELKRSYPERELELLATDRNAELLERAAIGCYRRSSLRELPAAWIDRAFTNVGDGWCLDAELRRTVTFECQDLRQASPSGIFDVILCRNLAFSYFDLAEQRTLAKRLKAQLASNGALVLGLDEVVPDEAGLERWQRSDLIWRPIGE